MPELPEVETVARQLDPDVRGLKVNRTEIRDRKLAGPDWSRAEGFSIERVWRVSKRVVFDLAKGKQRLWIAVHLRMTGRLIWVPSDGGTGATARGSSSQSEVGSRKSKAGVVPSNATGEAPMPPDKSLRLIFHLSKGEVRFYDTRRFGTVELLAEEPQLTGPALDPLSRQFTAKALGALLQDARGEIKPWLLRQDRIAGMGNIYASESLFLAGIDPRRSGGDLDANEVKALRDAIADVMRRAVAKAGTTFSDYMDSRGKSGGFREFLQVYGRAGQPCRKCGTPIEQVTQQQRSTFYCSVCQK